MSHEQLTLKGTLEGHNGWVTQIATNHNFPNMILSASRGKRSKILKISAGLKAPYFILFLNFKRQNLDRLEVEQGRDVVRHSIQIVEGPQSLCVRCCHLVRRSILFVRFMGRHS
jgi:hypothetical protein